MKKIITFKGVAYHISVFTFSKAKELCSKITIEKYNEIIGKPNKVSKPKKVMKLKEKEV